MKRIIITAYLAVLAVLFCSCAGKTETHEIKAIDFTDYTAEEVLAWAVENDVPQLIRFVYTTDTDKSSGAVISQSVKSGEPITDGIEITVADKPVLAATNDRVTVPNIIGKTLDEAKAELEKLKLTIDVKYDNSGKPKDTVILSDPLPCSSVPTGAKVLLTVSSGRGKENLLSIDFTIYEKLTDSVTVKVYVNGELDRSKTVTIDPSEPHKIFSFSGTGKSEIKFKVNSETYATYELDFDRSEVNKIG